MKNKWLAEAVKNNAAWCDVIAASHGNSTDWNDSAWVCENPMPRFYPNIVTLRSGSLIDKQIDYISPHLPLVWAIKDSFCELDLKNKGFTAAFDAHWYCRVPAPCVEIDGKKPQRQFATVNSQSELGRWVSAWGEGSGIFNTVLLENNAIELIHLERDGNVLCGLATNQSGNSVGISNTFGEPDLLLSCVTSVVARHPNKAIVGYGSKTEIADLSIIGFQEIGDLRVWVRKP